MSCSSAGTSLRTRPMYKSPIAPPKRSSIGSEFAVLWQCQRPLVGSDAQVARERRFGASVDDRHHLALEERRRLMVAIGRLTKGRFGVAKVRDQAIHHFHRAALGFEVGV